MPRDTLQLLLLIRHPRPAMTAECGIISNSLILFGRPFGRCHMFQHNLQQDFSWKAASNWLLLTFLAGSVNAGGFLACQRFVTHVTGFATLFGIDAARGRWDIAVGILSVPAFFLLGSFVATLLVDRKIRHPRPPRYALVMGLVTLCLVGAALGGYFNLFGEFGHPVRLKQDYFFLALLCSASGLQNTTITLSSNFSVRTTHLTGTTTDLGISLARFFVVHAARARQRDEQEAMWLKGGTIAAFAAGSAVGALLFMRVHYLGFLMPAAISLYAMILALPSPRGALKFFEVLRRGGSPP